MPEALVMSGEDFIARLCYRPWEIDHPRGPQITVHGAVDLTPLSVRRNIKPHARICNITLRDNIQLKPVLELSGTFHGHASGAIIIVDANLIPI